MSVTTDPVDTADGYQYLRQWLAKEENLEQRPHSFRTGRPEFLSLMF